MTGASLAHAGATRELRIGGIGAGLIMVKRLVEATHLESAGTRANFTNTGGAGAFRALRDDALDVAVTAREPPRAFLDQGFRSRPLMRSPLVFVTETGNPATSVSRSDIEKAYSGGGRWPDGMIMRVVVRPRGDVDTELVRSLSPTIGMAVERASRIEGFHWAGTDAESLAAVERIRGSLAPSTLAMVKLSDYRVKVLALENVEPSRRAVEEGSYPLAKTVWITTRHPSSPAVDRLLETLSSRRSSILICESGGIPWQSSCS